MKLVKPVTWKIEQTKLVKPKTLFRTLFGLPPDTMEFLEAKLSGNPHIELAGNAMAIPVESVVFGNVRYVGLLPIKPVDGGPNTGNVWEFSVNYIEDVTVGEVYAESSGVKVLFDAASQGWTHCGSKEEFLLQHGVKVTTGYRPQPAQLPERYPCLVYEVAETENRNGSDLAHFAFIYDFEFDLDLS